MVWLESYSIPNTFSRLPFTPTSDFSHANVRFSALRAKIPKNFTLKSAIFGYNLCFTLAVQAEVSFLGSSLNAVVVLNAKRAA